MANEDVRFQMGMDVQVDSVDQAKVKLKELNEEMAKLTSGVKLNVNEQDIEKTKNQISALERSIKEVEQSGGTFGTVFERNLKDITSETKKATVEMGKLDREAKQFGTAGQKGFQSVSKAAKLATADIRGTQTQMDKLRVNMEQGLGQTLAFGAIGAVSGGFISALNVAKELDQVTTDIRIVSGQTADEMKEYRDAASDASDILGTTTQKYLEASLIYKQQGGEAAYYARELAESTVVAANISGVATDQMSEYLTSTINGFELLAEKGGEAGTYVSDVLAQLGAASGSDLAEVATGLTRVAATAKEAGYEFEEISTMIATVSERTRRSPETIGNAFKSILANFNQIKEASDDEAEEFTSKVEESFKAANLDISIFDNGALRDASDIFKDIAANWDTMTKEQQALVATNVAGKYQMENFIAFMESQERYTDLLEGAYEAAGTSANQQLVYMDSFQAKVDGLKNAWQEAVDKVVDSDMFKGILEDLTNAVKLVGSMESGMGGLAVAMAPIIGVGGNFFAAPKLKESYINSQINSSLVSNEDIEKSVKALNLQESAQKRLIQEKIQEREITRETSKIMQQLGPEAAARYQEMADEAANLHSQLSLVKEDEKERAQLGREVAEQIQKGVGPKGINQAALFQRAGELDADDSFAVTEKKNEADAERNLALQKENLAYYGKIEDSMREVSKYTSTNVDRMVGWQTTAENILDLGTHINKEEKEKLQNIVKTIDSLDLETDLTKENLNKNTALKEELEEIERIHNKVVSAQQKQVGESEKALKNAQQERKTTVQGAAATEQIDAITDQSKDVRANLSLIDRAKEKMSGLAQKGINIERTVRGVATAYQAVVPLIATYNAAQEGTLSQQDAVITGTQALSTALLSSMNPWGMAAGAVVGAVGLVIDHFDLFKEKGEKAKEANEELIKSFLSLQEQVSSNQQNLSGVQEIYEAWTGVDVKTFLNNKPDPANEEAMQKYTEQLKQYDDMANKVAATNPEVIKGYDETGRVIIDLSKSFEQLMKVQEKAAVDNYVMMNQNSDSFVAQQVWEIGDAQKQLNKYSRSLTDAKDALSKGKEAGDESAIGSALKDMAKAQNKMGELQKTFSEVKGSIQTNLINPFNEASLSFNELIEKSPELEKTFEQFSDSYLNTDLISSMASLGQEDEINNLMNNLGKIRDEYVALGNKNPEAAKQFIEEFANASEWAKQGLFETNKTVEDLQKSMKNFADPLQDMEKRSVKYIDSILSEKDVREIQKRMDNIAESAKETGKKAVSQTLAAQSGNLDDEDIRPIYSRQDKADVEAIREKTSEYNQYKAVLGEVSDAYEKTSRSVQGFNENVDKTTAIENAANALKDLSKNGFDTQRIEELKASFPSLAQAMEDAAAQGPEAFAKASSNMYERLRDEHTAAITGMMMNNEAFFTEWRAANNNAVTYAAQTYGIDAANYQTMAQYKTALENLSYEQLVSILNAKVAANDEGNDKTTESNAKAAEASITFSQIMKDESLSNMEKLHYGMLVVWDGIVNTVGGAINTITNLFDNMLNKLHKGLGNLLSKFAETAAKVQGGNKTLEKEAKNFDKWGEGGTGLPSVFEKQDTAGDYLKGLRDKETERQGVIQDILDGAQGGKNSNSEIAKRLNLLNKQDPNSLTMPKDIAGAKDPGTGTGKDKEDKDKKEVENLELELDRYYKLENLLKRVEDRYTELSQAKDAAYGQDKLNLMQQEQNLLQERAGILHNYSNELSKEQAELRNKLVSNGFSFETNGDIANLNQRLTALQNEANSKAGEAKEEAIKNVKKIQEEAKRYTDVTFNLIPDKKKALDEIRKQLSDIAKERIEYQIKLQVDKNDLKKQVIDTVKELNDGFANSDERLQLTGQAMKVSLDEVDFYKNKISQIQNDPGLTDSARQELLQDANKSLLSAVSNAQSAYKDLGAIQAEYVKELKEAFDVINDRYENILDKSDTLIDKTSELYGNRGYGKIQEYYKVQEEALGDQLAYLVDAQKEMIRYRNTLNQSTDAWKEANDAVNELGEKIESNLLRKLESVRKQFEAFTADLESKFENMFGTWGFQGAQDDFNKLIEKQDKYFNSFEKLSTIGQRIKSINEEIAKTNDPQRAAELTALREKEYDTLLKGEKVSQDDYERAEKLYQIKLKELALEERQNAKRIAQLVRDENGNMSYEYVRQETEDMQEELDELQKQKDDLYKFDSDKVRESAQGVFDVISKYQEQIKELQSKGLSESDYKKELQKLLDDAESEIKDKTDEMNKWLANAGKDGISSLENMINKGVIDPEELGLDKNTLQSVFSALNDGSLTIQDMLSGDYGDFASSLGKTSEELKSQMDSMLELILGDNFDIAQAMIEASNKWTNTAQTNVNLLGDAYAQYMSQADAVLKQYNNSTGTLNTLLNQTNAAANTVINTTKNQTNAMIQAQQQTDKYSSSVKNLTNKLVGANGLYSGMVQVNRTMNEQLQPSMVATGNTTDILSRKTNYSADKYRLMAGEATSAYTRVNAFRDEPTKRAMDRIDEITSKSNRSASAFRSINTDASKARQSVLDFSGAVQNLKSYGAYKLDTGGLVSGATGMYTGTWNNSANNAEGRLALLHQKEIVLNQTDTENLLEAVHMQRDLLKSIEGRGGTAETMVNRMSSNIQNVQNNSTQTVSQPVTIYADFPNVNKSVEIENAFAGMFTQASTYIGKKN